MKVILNIITSKTGRLTSTPITREEASEAVADVFNLHADSFAHTDVIVLDNGYILKITAAN